MTRQLFVTTALPYANGKFHIGHIMEYIQADICAVPAHGGHRCISSAPTIRTVPIMIAAEKAGKTPQQFVADIAAGRKGIPTASHIRSINWHSTDGVENHELAGHLPRPARQRPDRGPRDRAVLRPRKGMFLPTASSRANVPEVRREGPVRRLLRELRRRLQPHRAEDPYSALSGATPVLKTSDHYFFKLSDPRCVEFLQNWTTEPGKLQPEVVNKIKEWFTRRRGQGRPGRLGHQPRRALLRHRDPGRAGQVFLRLAGRADRLPGLAEELVRQDLAAK